MFFLIGERIRRKTEAIGARQCAICVKSETFMHVVETNWFSLFAIPLLPLEVVADYVVCRKCESAYPYETSTEPSQVDSVKLVTTYILTGYGMQNQTRVMQEIVHKICGFEFSSGEINRFSGHLAGGDIFELLGNAASTMNDRARLQVIEAAFLSTHVCCEIQYEDRLRINLIGNALGVSLQFVEYAIEEVRRHRFYDVQRLVQSP